MCFRLAQDIQVQAGRELPLELVDYILTFLLPAAGIVDQDPWKCIYPKTYTNEEAEGKRLLLPCSAVCRSWNAVVRRRLFRVLSLTCSDGLTEDDSMFPTLEDLLESIVACPGVLPSVRTLRLSMQCNVTRFELAQPTRPAAQCKCSILSSFLQQFTGLQDLHLYNFSVIMDEVAATGPSPHIDLDRLYFTQTGYQGNTHSTMDQVMSTFLIFGHIKELNMSKLSCVDDPGLWHAIDAPTALQVNSLVLEEPYPAALVSRYILNSTIVSGSRCDLKKVSLPCGSSDTWSEVVGPLLYATRHYLCELEIRFVPFELSWRSLSIYTERPDPTLPEKALGRFSFDTLTCLKLTTHSQSDENMWEGIGRLLCRLISSPEQSPMPLQSFVLEIGWALAHAWEFPATTSHRVDETLRQLESLQELRIISYHEGQEHKGSQTRYMKPEQVEQLFRGALPHLKERDALVFETRLKSYPPSISKFAARRWLTYGDVI